MPATLVMMCALLAVGCGYMVFSRNPTPAGYAWDLGFIVFASAFLVSFIWLIWRHARAQVSRSSEEAEEDESR